MSQTMATISLQSERLITLGTNILVKPDETPEYKGKIIIPANLKSICPTTGVVVGIGANLISKEGEYATPIRMGDRVIYSKYAGAEMKFDNDERLMCMKEEDVLCIIGNDVKLKEADIG